jgi:shikimate kinase
LSIILVGRSKQGKSTISNLLCKNTVMARIDPDSEEIYLECTNEDSKFKIGHKLAAETKLPNF